jgi:hypothetical protein
VRYDITAASAAYLNNALQLTAYSLRFAALRFGFRQQLKASVRPLGPVIHWHTMS